MNKISVINPNNLGEVLREKSYADIFELSAFICSEFWAPGVYNSTNRNISNFQATNLLVLDIDSGHSLEESRNTFKAYKHIIATTRHHQKPKQGVICDRYRVVLFLSEEIKREGDFRATWEQAYKQWPFIDKACKDASRFFYPCDRVESIRKDGNLWTVLCPQESPLISPVVGSSATAQTSRQTSERGELWKSTLKFLLEGAPAGHRHNELVKAVGNMKDQGFTKDEVILQIKKMIALGGSWTQAWISDKDMKEINHVFTCSQRFALEIAPQADPGPEVVMPEALWQETKDHLSDKRRVEGESTGFDGLDEMLGGGFRKGELTVLMAQAKTGKNTLYHNLVYKYLTRGVPFGYASRELNPATEVIPDLLSIHMQKNAWKAEMTDGYAEAAREALVRWPLYFTPGYGFLSITQMETFFRKCVEIGVEHFLFDHFHHALYSEDYDTTSKVIKKMKSLTKELNIHLSLIVQPKYLQPGQSLGLDSLRGGAVVGQALDNLLILTRVPEEQNVSKLVLEVARHKLAKPGKMYFKYDPETITMIEVERGSVLDVPPTEKEPFWKGIKVQ